MRTTYGVVWREGRSSLARGRLELRPSTVHLEGLAGSIPVTRELPYKHLDGVTVGRTTVERLNGQPTLVLEPRTGPPIVLTAVAQTGIVPELTERLTRIIAA